MKAPRRTTKIPDKFKPVNKDSKTFKKRLKKLQEAKPVSEREIDLEDYLDQDKTLIKPRHAITTTTK